VERIREEEIERVQRTCVEFRRCRRHGVLALCPFNSLLLSLSRAQGGTHAIKLPGLQAQLPFS